ncbi:hypothetical protein F5X96DRAFT_659369, partial [Biscogniauxia mediterranea]
MWKGFSFLFFSFFGTLFLFQSWCHGIRDDEQQRRRMNKKMKNENQQEYSTSVICVPMNRQSEGGRKGKGREKGLYILFQV